MTVSVDPLPLLPNNEVLLLKNLIVAISKLGSGGGVTSVFGRTGVVVATTGDYTAAQVTNAQDITGVLALAGFSSITGTLANANLAGSGVTTIGTTGIALGATSLTLAGLTSVAATTFTGALTGNASTATALANARTIGGVSFDGTANITVATATGGFTVSGGALALGANDLTMTGSLGTTGSRLTKGWFTDLQVTNAIAGSITGNAATVTTNANLTGDVTSVGNATTIATVANVVAGTLASARGGTGVSNAGTLTNASNTTITGGGTLALGGFTATIPATDTVAMLGVANTFSGANVFSAAGAASTPAIKLSGTPFAGTGTTSFPLFYINDTTATASTTLNTAGTAFGVNSHGTQDLMNLLKDGASKFKVGSDGTLTTAAGATFSGNVTVNSGQLICTSGFLGSSWIANWNGNDAGFTISNSATTGYSIYFASNNIHEFRKSTNANSLRVFTTFTARGAGTTNLECLDIHGTASANFVIQSMKGSAGGTARGITFADGAIDTNGVITAGTTFLSSDGTGKIGLFTTTPVAQPSRAGQLTDNSGGTGGGNTIAAIAGAVDPTAATVTSTANAIATLAARLNSLEGKISAAGTGIGVTA